MNTPAYADATLNRLAPPEADGKSDAEAALAT